MKATVTASFASYVNTTVFFPAFPISVGTVKGKSSSKSLQSFAFSLLIATFDTVTVRAVLSNLTFASLSSPVSQVVCASAYAALKFATDTASLDFSNCEEKI